MDLKLLRDRRVVIAAAGVALALAAGLGFGLIGRGRAPEPGPASPSDAQALQVEMGSEDLSQDLARQVRCFAAGQYVGMLSLAACAERNGVAPGAMDVGIDATGAAAATATESSEPPAVSEAPAASAASAAPAETGPSPVGVCWMNTGVWRKLADGVTLDACVQALFAGRCTGPGSAIYGRWGEQTLRLTAGRVERSYDNRTFQLLARQTPGNCAVPHLAE